MIHFNTMHISKKLNLQLHRLHFILPYYKPLVQQKNGFKTTSINYKGCKMKWSWYLFILDHLVVLMLRIYDLMCARWKIPSQQC